MFSTPPRLSFVLRVLALGAFLAACLLLGAFHLLDRDFWWHITAGQMMWETGRIIGLDPFAYTREGLPYIATHEWLAQVVLYWVHRIGGTDGVIVFRSLMMMLTFGFLLRIDHRRLWPNALFAIVGVSAMLSGFLERPQLFTFAILAAQLLIAYRYFDLPTDALRPRIHLLIGFIALQILWPNMHGAAAMVGIGVAGSIFLQRLLDSWMSGTLRYRLQQREIWILLGLCIVSGIALFLTPSGAHTIGYLNSLLTDKTIAFISEWRPREHGYLLFMGPMWLIALIPLALTRRKFLFSLLLVLVLGAMSLRAFRHEMLFTIAAMSVCFYQLKHNAQWQKWLDKVGVSPLFSTLSFLLLFPIAAFASVSYRQTVERDNLWGYGVFAPAQGAAEFVDRENIRGNMFNTYGIGGYLIHRFHNQEGRKVFIDGRNVDYGFAFMNEAFVAGHTQEEWKVIEDKWKLTYAFIDYDAIKQPGWLSYSHVLDTRPGWSMVYIDDWTAVYLKDTPENKAAIEKHRYQLLTAEGLEFSWALEKTPKEKRGELEAELRRAIESSPTSVKARNLLAKMLLSQGKVDDVLSIADDIERIQPHRPEAWALRGAVAMIRQDYTASAEAFRTMIKRAGENYPDINYAILATVFEKAGDEKMARHFRRRAGIPQPTQGQSSMASSQASSQEGTQPTVTPPVSVTETGSMPTGLETVSGTGGAVGELLSGIGEDIQKYNDQGVDLAQNGDLKASREAFLKALMLDPGNPLTLSNLSALEMQDGDLDKAIEYGERALERGEEFGDAHYNLALALYRAGKLEDAEKHAERAEELGKDAGPLLGAIRMAR